ncbi:MAG: hypothetical protein Rhob2KO_45450 [Rhodopirellula baltica]
MRFPAEFALDFAGVDRVAEVVAGAVGHEGDEGGVTFCPLTLALSPVSDGEGTFGELLFDLRFTLGLSLVSGGEAMLGVALPSLRSTLPWGG